MINMQQRIKQKCFFIFITLIISFIGNTDASYLGTANTVEVSFDAAGGLLPVNNTNLQMINADVLFFIDETFGEKGQFRIVFDGNYTIFNPNETIESMIGAPFFSFNEDMMDLIEIKVENTVLEYEVFELYEINENYTIWEEYFDVNWYLRYLALSNVTFVGYSNTTIRYCFDVISYPTMDRNMDLYGFYYDVGTAAAWNGNITETVTFSINGKQPHSYSCYSYNETNWINKEPEIEEIENGFKYSWIWENERIEEKIIEIGYSSSDIWLVEYNNLILVGLSIISLVILNRKKRIKRKTGN